MTRRPKVSPRRRRAGEGGLALLDAGEGDLDRAGKTRYGIIVARIKDERAGDELVEVELASRAAAAD